jgi:phosphoribosyl 1,2-cyclic phosphate phosphodiesterase
MKLRFLGTGTSRGNPELGCSCEVCTSKDKKDWRFRSSALVEVEGKHILLDCGPDFRMQMLETFKNTPFKYMDGILITHEHYDHVGGLDDLRFFSYTKEVNVYAEESVSKAIKERIPYVFQENKYPGIPNIHLTDIAEEAFYIDGIKIIPIRIMHGNLPILGYRIGNMAYLTDVKIIPEKEFAKLKDLDVLIISALREEPHISHESLAEALENIKKINPKRAYLIHMNHTFGLHEKMQKQLPEKVFIAYDGLEVNIIK